MASSITWLPLGHCHLRPGVTRLPQSRGGDNGVRQGRPQGHRSVQRVGQALSRRWPPWASL